MTIGTFPIKLHKINKFKSMVDGQNKALGKTPADGDIYNR